VFKTGRTVPAFDAVNRAGGKAYSLDNEKALCQYAVTNCFNSTFYASSDELLDEVKKISDGCSSEVIAKAAVYAAENAKMKDMPAYLAAILAARGEIDLLRKVFPRVIYNSKMLCNFVQIVRSGATGRKSFGTAVKKLISNWLTNRRPDQLFYDDIGKGNPSLADIIRMVHPKATTAEQNNMFKYVLGREFNLAELPKVVSDFEEFKKNSDGVVPNVPFQCLSNIKLSETQWKNVAQSMPWNTLRMNLNQIGRHDVLKDKKVVKALAEKLADSELVKKSNSFPYQLMTTYLNTHDVPVEIKNALQAAMEAAVENVPSYEQSVAVCIDVSGSMGSPITGYRTGSTTTTTCVQVAGLIASVILRRNKDSIVIPFDTKTHNNVVVNPYDSILTNAQKLAIGGGGTDCGCATWELLRRNEKRDLVIYVSDNESWADHDGTNYGSMYGSTKGKNLAAAWVQYKAKNKKAKLVLIDLTPNARVQVKPQKDVLCIGGFSDQCFSVINNFVRSGDSDEFVKTVRAIAL
jgi:60 kDa SS-A/Ro ribonucleoprotein